jgi:hypothetical protein
MKEAYCVNSKMAAYYKAIREVEDKFHVLELKHVLRKYNEVPTLSQRRPRIERRVPNGVFASDLREPSIRYEEDNHPSAPDLQEVMALGEASEDPD